MTDLPALALGVGTFDESPSTNQTSQTNRLTKCKSGSLQCLGVSAASPRSPRRHALRSFAVRESPALRRLNEVTRVLERLAQSELTSETSRPLSRSAWARPDPGADGSRRQYSVHSNKMGVESPHLGRPGTMPDCLHYTGSNLY